MVGSGFELSGFYLFRKLQIKNLPHFLATTPVCQTQSNDMVRRIRRIHVREIYIIIYIKTAAYTAVF